MSTLLSMLRQPRYEVIPARSAEQAIADHIPPGSTVAVTASAAKGLDATFDLVERLTAAGVDDVFVPGGDSKEPAGCFDGALPLLERLTQMSNPFRSVGITGYPESVPHISDDVTIQSMWDKRRHATYIVSNVCFNPTTLRAWIARIRARGVTLPLYVGLSGPAERARLLRLAAVSGATESVRFLARHPAWVLRLGLPGGYHPERFCERAGEFGPGDGVVGVHLFTFNQIKHIEEWRRCVL